jgi:hypothetical protein
MDRISISDGAASLLANAKQVEMAKRYLLIKRVG